jgi:hypothetical protein
LEADALEMFRFGQASNLYPIPEVGADRFRLSLPDYLSHPELVPMF